MRHLLVSTLVFISVTISFSQTISTDRPTQAFSTATMPSSTFQLETGLGLDLFPGSSMFTIGFNQFKYGVTDQFELRTGFGIAHDMDADSWTGFNVSGLKVNLLDTKIQLSLLSEVVIPTSTDLVSWYNAVLLSHDVTDKINFGYMFLYNYDFNFLNANSYSGNAQFSWVSNFSLVENLTFFVEISIFSDLTTSFIPVYLDAGFMYIIGDNMQIDLFFGQGVNFQRGSYGVGFSYFFK